MFWQLCASESVLMAKLKNAKNEATNKLFYNRQKEFRQQTIPLYKM